MKYKKGFTLIELLVVIAIISLVSSVALAGLRSASNKANDSKVKASLDGIRKQSSIHFDNNNSYTTLCSVEPGLSMISAARSAGGGTVVNTNCNTSTTQYSAFSVLKSGGSYCVDSSGNSKSYGSITIPAGYSCP